MILIFKHRQFFLFNDLLVYGNIVINKKKYNKQVGLFYIPNDVITTQFAAFNSLGRSEIKILGGWGAVQEWLAHLYKVQEIGVGGSCKNLNLIGLLVKPHYVRGKSFAVFAATATEKQEWMAHINKCIEVPPSSPITHLCSYSIKRICYGSLEKRQWTSMLLSGCRTVKLALACTAKRLVVYSLFISTRFYLFRSNSRWSIVAITAESVGLCAATHVVQRGADTRSKSSTYLWNSSATILSPGSSSRRNPPNRWESAWPAMMSFPLNQLTSLTTKVRRHHD